MALAVLESGADSLGFGMGYLAVTTAVVLRTIDVGLHILGQVVEIDVSIVTQNEAVFDDVLELTHIAWKTMTHEYFHDGGCDP